MMRYALSTPIFFVHLLIIGLCLSAEPVHRRPDEQAPSPSDEATVTQDTQEELQEEELTPYDLAGLAAGGLAFMLLLWQAKVSLSHSRAGEPAPGQENSEHLNALQEELRTTQGQVREAANTIQGLEKARAARQKEKERQQELQEQGVKKELQEVEEELQKVEEELQKVEAKKRECDNELLEQGKRKKSLEEELLQLKSKMEQPAQPEVRQNESQEDRPEDDPRSRIIGHIMGIQKELDEALRRIDSLSNNASEWTAFKQLKSSFEPGGTCYEKVFEEQLQGRGEVEGLLAGQAGLGDDPNQINFYMEQLFYYTYRYALQEYETLMSQVVTGMGAFCDQKGIQDSGKLMPRPNLPRGVLQKFVDHLEPSCLPEKIDRLKSLLPENSRLIALIALIEESKGQETFGVYFGQLLLCCRYVVWHKGDLCMQWRDEKGLSEDARGVKSEDQAMLAMEGCGVVMGDRLYENRYYYENTSLESGTCPQAYSPLRAYVYNETTGRELLPREDPPEEEKKDEA